MSPGGRASKSLNKMLKGNGKVERGKPEEQGYAGFSSEGEPRVQFSLHTLRLILSDTHVGS